MRTAWNFGDVREEFWYLAQQFERTCKEILKPNKADWLIGATIRYTVAPDGVQQRASHQQREAQRKYHVTAWTLGAASPR
jgi:hypothetical protein